MEEKAAHAVRTKRDSSMRVGLKLVREGKAKGFVTAGNTGAAMATAKMVLGALPGVDRPALATPMPSSNGQPVRAARCGRQRRLQGAQPGAIRRDGRDVCPQRAQDRATARRPALHRRRRDQGQRPHPRGVSAAEGAADQVHRQRGRARHLQRTGRRDCLRRICGQRGAEDQRRRGAVCARRAARVADANGDGARWVRCFRGRRSTISAAGWIIANTAARNCWACAESASSATDHRTIAPSSMASAWPTSLPMREPTSASSRNSSSGRFGVTDRATQPRTPQSTRRIRK